MHTLHSLCGKIEFLACIEPDPMNYRKLCSYLEKHGEDIASIIVSLPVGIYSTTCSMRFGQGKSFNSSLDENGPSVIQCAALDELLPKCAPTFINMDVEGAELEGLKGCQNIIRKYAPDLAICIYHSPDHLWRIPLLLESMQENYKFYLRNYTGFVAETVLYATIPKNL